MVLAACAMQPDVRVSRTNSPARAVIGSLSSKFALGPSFKIRLAGLGEIMDIQCILLVFTVSSTLYDCRDMNPLTGAFKQISHCSGRQRVEYRSACFIASILVLFCGWKLRRLEL